MRVLKRIIATHGVGGGPSDLLALPTWLGLLTMLLSRQAGLYEPPDGLSSRRNLGLLTAPFINLPPERSGEPDLVGANFLIHHWRTMRHDHHRWSIHR